jgi:NADH-quinone oxidoreductase subunit F
MEKIKTPKELEKLRQEILAGQKKDAIEVTVCGGTGCLSNGSEQVAAAISEEMKKQGLNGKAVLKKTGCHGFCERGPLVTINPMDIFYQRVAGTTPPTSFPKPDQQDRGAPATSIRRPRKSPADEIPFYQHQFRIALRNNGRIDPTDIRAYLANGGYAGLAKAVTSMTVRSLRPLKSPGCDEAAAVPGWKEMALCCEAKGDVRYLVARRRRRPGALWTGSWKETPTA